MSETNNFMTFSEEIGSETMKLIQNIMDNGLQSKKSMFAIATTGKGKSYFVKNELYNYCKAKGYKILYLLPRKVVKEEFIKELQAENKTSVITVKAYQEFERREEYPSFLLYDIIVCDECHYFISDSTFNPFTFRSYERIFSSGADKLKIFITATPKPVIDKIYGTIVQHNTNDIPIEKRHGLHVCELEGVSVVRDIKFFKIGYDEQKKKNVQNILDKIDQTAEDKAIIFCDSKTYAHELYEQEKYKGESLFICSQSNGNKYEKDNAASEKSADHQKYLHMLTEHNFDCKYVFCTSALDVGFSIKDRQVKHIICMLQDWNSVIQAVGRKRLMDNDLSDRIILYLPYYSNQTIGKKRKETLECFEHWKYLDRNGATAYMEEYEKIPDPAKIVYYRHTENGACEPAIDDFVLWYYRRKAQIYADISQIDSTEQHQDWILQQFGLPNKRHKRTLYGIERDLKPFADSKRVFTQKDKQIIVDIINHKNKKNGLQVKSMAKLEEYLQKIGCRYMIFLDSKRETIDGKDKKTTTYQIIERPTGQA